MANTLDVRRMQLLAQVVKDQSFSKAAESLNVSQPALSKSIRMLEKSIGVKLLERGRFGAKPTAFALSLVRHADAIDAELRVAENEIQALKSAQSGSLRIGCGPSEATRLLPLALAELSKHSPDVKVTVLYGLNESLLPWVKHGDVDVALSSIPQQCGDPDLKRDPLHHDQGAIVSRAGHPLSKQRKPISIEQLGEYDWVLAPSLELERKALDDVFSQAGFAPPIPVVETTSTTLMKSMVMQSDSLTFLPRELAYWEIRAKQLQFLRLKSLDWKRMVGITTRARSGNSPAREAFVSAVRKASRRFSI